MNLIPDYPIENIRLEEPYRSLSQEQVERLKESIGCIGLRQPIQVRTDGTLVFGRHRFEACRELGWRTIPALMVEEDELTDELARIDENLCRNELTHAERMQQISRRKELYEILFPQTQNGVAQGEGMRRAVGHTDLTAFCAVRSVCPDELPPGPKKQQFFTLIHARGEDGMTVKELVTATGTPDNGVRPRLAEMVRDGYLRRQERNDGEKQQILYIAIADAPSPDPAADSFVTHTAKVSRRSKRAIWKDVQIAQKIAPDVMEQIPGTPIADRLTDLETLSRQPQEQQREIIAKIKGGEASTVPEAMGTQQEKGKASKRSSRGKQSANLSVKRPKIVALEQAETLIEGKLEAFLDVAHALFQIREQALYTEQYGEFHRYLKERWAVPFHMGRTVTCAVDSVGICRLLEGTESNGEDRS